MNIAYYESPLGRITIAGHGDCLCGLWFEGQKYYLGKYKSSDFCAGEIPVFTEARTWLDIYFSGKQPCFTPQLDYGNTRFSGIICDIMLGIPYGNTMTYGEIAAIAALRMGEKHMSAQAVGGAVGHNPVSLIIPCHRVVGANGSLTGYAGGIERKRYLLELEGNDMSRFV